MHLLVNKEPLCRASRNSNPLLQTPYSLKKLTQHLERLKRKTMNEPIERTHLAVWPAKCFFSSSLFELLPSCRFCTRDFQEVVGNVQTWLLFDQINSFWKFHLCNRCQELVPNLFQMWGMLLCFKFGLVLCSHEETRLNFCYSKPALVKSLHNLCLSAYNHQCNSIPVSLYSSGCPS